jgi:Protein of unknown function (DUF3995)
MKIITNIFSFAGSMMEYERIYAEVSEQVKTDSNLLQWAGYAAFIWSILFGLIHIYWAFGGIAGLEGQKIVGVLFIINLVAIVLCFVAAIVALGFVQSWGRRIPSWILLTLAWIASVILGLRGGVGIIQSLIESGPVPFILIIVEPFFLLGGILFGITAVLFTCSKRNRK